MGRNTGKKHNEINKIETKENYKTLSVCGRGEVKQWSQRVVLLHQRQMERDDKWSHQELKLTHTDLTDG